MGTLQLGEPLEARNLRRICDRSAAAVLQGATLKRATAHLHTIGLPPQQNWCMNVIYAWQTVKENFCENFCTGRAEFSVHYVRRASAHFRPPPSYAFVAVPLFVLASVDSMQEEVMQIPIRSERQRRRALGILVEPWAY